MSAAAITTSSPAPGVLVVAVDGDLDLATAATLETEIHGAMRAATADALLLDLADAGWMDSTGVELVLELERHYAAGRGVVVLRPSRAVRRLLEILRLQELRMAETVQEAMQLLGAAAGR